MVEYRDRVATDREKSRKMKKFQGQGKSGNFLKGQGIS